MERVGKFEKVSYEQFYTAIKDCFGMDDSVIRDLYDGIELPTRATSGSAVYDFKSPIRFDLAPGCTIKVPTGIRVKIDSGWWLAALPRSGMGFKYRIQLDNTVGVIDEDYYGSSNEGHIFIKITNDTRENKTLTTQRPSGTAVWALRAVDEELSQKQGCCLRRRQLCCYIGGRQWIMKRRCQSISS